MNKYTLFIFIACLTGCNPQSKNLEVKLNQDNLCVFTNNSKTYYGIDNNFLIYLGKIDYNKGFKSTYEKLYSNAPLPIDEKNCVTIPLNEIERNIAYEIVLDTNKSFRTSICVMDKGNKLEVKYLEPGKSTCN
ncbi:hypothetical protein F909_01828 [Acinetobacter sp. ANC 3929]|uniref:NF045616 family extracytoplasmic (lipo)protein n=1 Tax=unclassified Acinetobacter TaxID=196816 RepID=UPI0002CDDFBB|nr:MULTISPECIES: NF045616 family extracytoplasmic (lipo)protein [unclassified Acinetobacter]ENW80542.1 hypothetical protein F909_01828 [Acinetobacter sp. ANC 3929]MCH7352843.1 hypothetical protein [Acinetobacter sp. NIPH 2023]MCH7354024.1 hypothetical protein [Acinetobacter sp. NIPH 1958]MCH7360500.1 hypothetical protein [Acinetobacter sp. NIPH 2024]